MSLKEAFGLAMARVAMGFPLRENLKVLRADVNAFDTGGAVGLVIGLMIAIVIFAAVIGTVAYQLYTAQQNASVKANSTATSLLPLVLTMFVIAGVVLPVGAVLVLLREHGTI